MVSLGFAGDCFVLFTSVKVVQPNRNKQIPKRANPSLLSSVNPSKTDMIVTVCFFVCLFGVFVFAKAKKKGEGCGGGNGTYSAYWDGENLTTVKIRVVMTKANRRNFLCVCYLLECCWVLHFLP